MKKILATIIAIGVMAPLAVQAENLYGTVSAGMALLSDSDLSFPDDPILGPVSGNAEFNAGYLVNAGVGYDFGNIRAEGVIHYQDNGIDTISMAAGPISVGGSADGDISTLAFMVNGYYDFDTGTSIEPFITGGIGWAQIEGNDVSFTDPVFGTVPLDDSDDSVFAWQIGLGAGFALNEMVSLDLTYRYFATSNPDFDGTEVEVGGHNISLGLRYNF